METKAAKYETFTFSIKGTDVDGNTTLNATIAAVKRAGQLVIDVENS